MTATITDSTGAVVRTIDIGELKAGVHTFTGRQPDRRHESTKRCLQSNDQRQQQDDPAGGAAAAVRAGRGVIKGSDGNKLDLGTSGSTTLDEVRQII